MDTEQLDTEGRVFLNAHGLWSVRPLDAGETDWLHFRREADARMAASMPMRKAIRFQDKLLQRHLREPDLLRDIPPVPKAKGYGLEELRRHSAGILRGHFSDIRSALLAPHEARPVDTLDMREVWEDAKRQWALAKVVAIYLWIKWRLASLCFWHGLRMWGAAGWHQFQAFVCRRRATNRRRGFLKNTASIIHAKEHEERSVLLARMANKKWRRGRQQLFESMRFDL